ncbi:hypothetical protein ACQ4M4_04460 [Leptolyngbya sp. AN02str]|uniref:hypothetical protein n=1 Tax=Leptolyngbya sp. AN02str TaxID=3423363 RepID=UPI003D3212A1
MRSFWSGKSDAETLLQTVREVESANWKTQLEAGIDRIGIGDTTLYDHVLDCIIRLGLIPDRVRHLTRLEQYFALARSRTAFRHWKGPNDLIPNHYLVPKVAANAKPEATFADFLNGAAGKSPSR